jgi:tRNA(Arg) A34 adenosine deaminase TadA/GNAT superfamily N-acetyltransferase
MLRAALQEAHCSRREGGDPFGAVLAEYGQVLYRSTDCTLALCDPTAHAELALISAYCRTAGRFNLAGCTLYSAVEPCAMCAAAAHWARVSRIVYAVSQSALQAASGGGPKPGCAEILAQLGGRVEVLGPLLPEEDDALLLPWPGPKATRIAQQRDKAPQWRHRVEQLRCKDAKAQRTLAELAGFPSTRSLRRRMELTIRTATPNDFAALDALFLEGDRWHALHEPAIFCTPEGPPRPHEYLQRLLDGPDSAILLAERDGEVLGLVMLVIRASSGLPMMTPRHVGMVDTLIVAAHARRQGVGHRLMAAAEDWCRQQGCTDIELTVWGFNKPARALYADLSYRPLHHRLGKTLR